ncbi:hypothetical protein ACRAQ7_00885 [Erythrobacter sp. W53]|uniref:hypothetical protein n=1 Tax=Erythrobacter sp. W53 TaxID=3425947 RepID=UPI003D767635
MRVMDWFHDLLFASDAKLLAMAGAGFLLVAGFASLMERRRGKARDIERLDQVGWVPWTSVFVGCAIIGGGMLTMSLPVVIGSL